ncbi:HEAT repeat domain-containing protein [Roseiconus lacunae]|uniref:DUF7133 domain-containing protein n=1 Tax=Roseiconus lacunae TaxID=2605694 RepID=UPI003085F78C|nr:HEAT repeat domain-containing protein [Stieleria sp. HD01]
MTVPPTPSRVQTLTFRVLVLCVLLPPWQTLVHAQVLETDSIASSPHPKLQYKKWSGDINVPDPVAVSVANNGTVYATQTQRRKIQDLDIRAHSEWIPDDVGLASIDDKKHFLRRTLAIGGDQIANAKHVEDLNQDGQYDWRDLTVISERIHRFADTDGDGVADETNVYAEGFQTEVTGIAAGVLHHEDSVYATIAPDVWKLTDSDGDDVADQRSVVATGFGLHIAYAGHDMHGLIIGPDGKLYWSIGDKGISVTTAEGKRFHYPNQGGVMRCNLDGSDFEVYAHGLRNVQEFAFDRFGNLFGVDNDSDRPGEKERFVWIVDQMDAGWRCNYQYRSDEFNPWTDERLWEIAGPEHPAYLLPPIRYFVDGPAGFKMNPGAALSRSYKDYFFMTEAPNGGQYAFRVEAEGDTFKMVDDHKIGEGVPIVGIAFGPDGGLYGADWGGGYPLTQSGSIQRIDVPVNQLSDAEIADRQSVVHWLNVHFSTLETDQLVDQLAHVDQRVRLRVQFELVSRKTIAPLVAIANNNEADVLARVHAIWAIGQMVRTGDISSDVLFPVLKSPNENLRAVAVKVLGESGCSSPDVLIPLLTDDDLHVRVHAALALGRCPSANALDALINLANQTPFNQHYMRHAITTAMTTCATPRQLAELRAQPSVTTRLCAVVALRRLRSPVVANYLDDPSSAVVTEAARAIHDDFSIPDALPTLANHLGKAAVPDAFTRRAINANVRLGTNDAASRLLRFATDETQPASMRADACDALGVWNAPPLLDRVDGRRRNESQTRSFDPQVTTKILGELIRQAPVEVRVAAAKAARTLKLTLSPAAMLALSVDDQTPVGLRLEALQMISEAGDHEIPIQRRVALFIDLSQDSTDSIATQALAALSALDPQKAMPVLSARLRDGSPAVKQTVIRRLAIHQSDTADEQLLELAKQLHDGSLDSKLSLDVYSAILARSPHSPKLSAIQNKINAFDPLESLPSDKHRQFAFARDGGNAKEGERIFRSDLRAQCSRCHRIGRGGSEIGPELTKIAKKRDADYLLRAVVYPSAEIDAKYNVQTVLMADGNVVQGVLKREDDDWMVLIDANGKEQKLSQEDIEQVADKQVSLMPDMTAVLSAAEVRDLVAYLKTLR